MLNLIPVALAQATPYVPVTEIVKSIYDVALMAGGILAFGAIVYGAARYTMAAGNPSGQHEGKDAITQALLGLLLLFASYLVLHTVNPTLTTLRLPKLVELKVEKDVIAPPSGFGVCQNNQCKNSPSVNAVLSCLPTEPKSYRQAQAITYQGAHHQNSCHFGGRLCTDGSHAVDWGFKTLTALGITPNEMIAAVTSCGQKTNVPTSCRCENEGGSKILPCGDPEANHIHCNVATAQCGCN